MKQGHRFGWNFDNSFTQLPQIFYSETSPTPVRSPELIKYNEPLAVSLGLSSQLENSKELEVFSGNVVPESGLPIAQAYAGHQFGHFTRLGDGRAILIGEQITGSNARFDIQLKGAGRTPYSRGGDGRATLGSMLREYIISEAMHALGIPTSRSLAVVTTGESVFRETEMQGAVLTRVSASHIRVGTFEYAAQWGDVSHLKTLADYTIERHFPEIKLNNGNPYLSLLKEVIHRQASLIAKWQLVGFIHGVMNTDNVSICGETFDYGPCAFMNEYDPATVFSSIDREGRYAYGNQPKIGGWNLARFAEALLPLLHEDQDEAVKLAQNTVVTYSDHYKSFWLRGMRDKLGLFNEEENDQILIEHLLELMQNNRADFTNTFRALTLNEYDGGTIFKTDQFKAWYDQWQQRLERQEQTKKDAQKLMKKTNPAVIPRNHRVEEALEAAVEKSDYHVLDKLLNVLSCPYNYKGKHDEYTELPSPTNQPYQTFCGT